jgi:hypothetical protein
MSAFWDPLLGPKGKSPKSSQSSHLWGLFTQRQKAWGVAFYFLVFYSHDPWWVVSLEKLIQPSFTTDKQRQAFHFCKAQ